LSFGIEKLAFGASCFNATEQLQKEQKETAARSELRTIAFSHRSTGSKCLVLEYLLQINFTNFPQEGHLIAAISPHNSGIVALVGDKSVPVA
jgi:hypothetical protein